MWIVPPSTCSPCAPATADSTSPLTSQQAALLAQSVTWNGKQPQPASLRRQWKPGHWITRLSGATCEPSTLARGVESWISSLAATRASRSVSPASVWGQMILDIYGPASLASLRKCNPASAFSRTSQGTLLWDSPPCDENSKVWATELRRDCLRRRKSARRIDASDCSYSPWPTAGANDGKGSNKPGQRRGQLDEATEHWSTPRTSDTNGAGQHGTVGIDLRTQADQFSPPDLPTAKHGPASSIVGQDSRPRLNPAFVEWLMGVPPGLTSCALSATELCHWRARMRSCLWRLTCSRRHDEVQPRYD